MNKEFFGPLLVALAFATNAMPGPNEDLRKAAIDGDIVRMRELLKVPGIDINGKGMLGLTPLYCATLWGHVDCLKELITHKASVDVQCGNDNTALHTAAFLGRVECVEELLAARADVTIQNADGKTAFQLARATCVEVFLAAYKKQLEAQGQNEKEEVATCESGN